MDHSKFHYILSKNLLSLKGFESPEYFVEDYRIVAIRKGHGFYTFDNTTVSMKPGDIYILGPHKRYIKFAKKNVHISLIKFSAPEDWIKKPYQRVIGEQQELDFLLHIISELINAPQDVLFNIALDYIDKLITSKNTRYPKIHNIAKHIKENPHLNFSVSNLAKKSGYSETHFRRVFREEFNLSPKAYIKSIKMDYAIYLIKHENLSIKAVAYHLSYNDIHEFSKQFKSVKGLSPKKYMNNLTL